jgi:hypothetical protein
LTAEVLDKFAELITVLLRTRGSPGMEYGYPEAVHHVFGQAGSALVGRFVYAIIIRSWSFSRPWRLAWPPSARRGSRRSAAGDCSGARGNNGLGTVTDTSENVPSPTFVNSL